MKSKVLIAAVLISSLIGFFAFKKIEDDQQPKILKVQTDIAGWQRVLTVIDYSTVDPKERIAVRDFIVTQLNDTTLNKVK